MQRFTSRVNFLYFLVMCLFYSIFVLLINYKYINFSRATLSNFLSSMTSPMTSNSSRAYTFGSVLVDVTKLGRHMKRGAKLYTVSRSGFTFNKIENCFNTSECKMIDQKDLDLCLQNRRRNSKFECDHFMILGKGISGRTGNQMFQVAALLATASYHGYTALIDPSYPLATWFDLPNLYHFSLRINSKFNEKKCCTYQDGIKMLSHSNNWTLSGYFQSWKYFEGAEEIIRNAFKLKNIYLTEATHYMHQIIVDKPQTVCVHIRRGDFTGKSANTRGYVVAPKGYVEKAMAYFRKRYERVHFFIVSDDKTWCRNNLKSPNVTVSPFNEIGSDLALMTICDHAIVTSGSFGWWGAWLSGGDVVYWQGYPGRGSWLESQFNKTHYYPRHWVGLTYAS